MEPGINSLHRLEDERLVRVGESHSYSLQPDRVSGSHLNTETTSWGGCQGIQQSLLQKGKARQCSASSVGAGHRAGYISLNTHHPQGDFPDTEPSAPRRELDKATATVQWMQN